MMRALLFARDPGGASVVLPLAEPLRGAGHRCGSSARIPRSPASARPALMGRTSWNACARSARNPCAPSWKEVPGHHRHGHERDDFTEKQLWATPRRWGSPPSRCWINGVNYGVRFSRFDVSIDSRAYEEERTHPFPPDADRGDGRVRPPRDDRRGDPGGADRGLRAALVREAVRPPPGPSAMEACSAAKRHWTGDFVRVFASEPMTATYSDPLTHWATRRGQSFRVRQGPG